LCICFATAYTDVNFLVWHLSRIVVCDFSSTFENIAVTSAAGKYNHMKVD